MPLVIRQGTEDYHISAAEYDTKPFTGSYYYSWRIGKWRGDDAWEFELVHHKIKLTNNPPDVQKFEISHGYNLLTINRAWLRESFVYRLGAGIVLAHPETIIGGLEFDAEGGMLGMGFYVSGPTLQATAGWRFQLGEKMFGVVEGKLTVSSAWVPIQDGDADASVVALHGLFGVGYEF